MRLKFTRFLIRFLLRLLARVEIRDRENIPSEKTFIIAANHIGLVDAFLPFYAINNTNLVLLVGEKWEKLAIMRWLGRNLNFIFVDRFNPDLKAIREVINRLKRGEALVITPEGTRSKVGTLLEGKPGVSYLAAKLGYKILPVAISGSFDSDFFGQLKRLHRPHVVVTIGKTFHLPPLPSDRVQRDEALKSDTEEIMCRIASLLPPEQYGFYTNHPRLVELLQAQA
jgi:1-acyl-sn-glycerol-3-phosphate acyltransferase